MANKTPNDDIDYPPLFDAVEPQRRRGISSAEVGFRVLDSVVSLGRASPLRDIAQAAGLPASQTHRYVSSLINVGMIKQDAASGHYDLGPMAIRVGLAAMARQDALQAAEKAARAVNDRAGANVTIWVWGSHGPTCIRDLQGDPPVYSNLTTGAVLPVSGSIAGQVFMSFLPPRAIDPFLLKEGWPKGITANPELMTRRDRIHADCEFRGASKTIPGLRASAAPIFTLDNRLVGVLAITASEAISSQQLDAMSSILLEQCRLATLDLGGVWPADDPNV